MIPTHKVMATIAVIAAATLLTRAADAQGATHVADVAPARVSPAQQEANKKVAVAFYNLALNEKNPDRAMQYIAADFKQHSVLVEDGYGGLRKFLEWVRTEQPVLHADITQSFADGDYVILNVRMIRHPGDRGLAIAEIYRLQGGKLVEHWDRMQEIPEKSKNDNGMF